MRYQESFSGTTPCSRSVDLYDPALAGRYNLITSDPPWQYGSRGARSGRFDDLDYPTMSTDEICALPVRWAAADPAVLLLWFTASFVKDAIKVTEAWGFNVVRIDRVWAKKTAGGARHAAPGPWGMSDCEFVLLGTIGPACSRLQTQRNGYTLHEAVYPGRHSQKPESMLQEFEDRFGGATRRLELFARTPRDGWDCWGNEV